MKSHRRLSLPENPVNFIKIILSDETGSTGLRLPEKFTNEYGNYLAPRVTLKVPNGDIWQVDIQTLGNDIWLKNGWGEIVERYGLGVSSLLMFKYEGLSTFDVVIFNASASEIEYPENTKKRDSVRTFVKRDARKRSVACDESKIIVLDDDTSSDSNGSEDQEHVTKINDEGECSTKTQRMEEGRRAIEKAKANFKSDKPLFMVYINESHFTNRGVLLPAAMSRLLSRGSKNRTCLLQLKNNGKFKEWNVAAQSHYLGSVDWLMFVKDSGVKVGDVCVFELSHKDTKVLSVTILRS